MTILGLPARLLQVGVFSRATPLFRITGLVPACILPKCRPYVEANRENQTDTGRDHYLKGNDDGITQG